MRAPTVSFDLDGVVMRGPFASAIRPRISEHLGRSAALSHLAGEDLEKHIWRAVRHEHDRRYVSDDNVGAWNWQAIYDQVSHALGCEPMPDLTELVREGCQREGAVALLPGARRGLERLTQAGVRLVAITNGYYDYQWPVLEKLGVAEFFEVVITPDVAGFAKPDPRVFGQVPGLRAHVGDLLMHDILGANRAGLYAIWVQPELPAELVELGPTERVSAPGFATYLRDTLDKSAYRRFHPEATVHTCSPAAVVRDVDEAASVVLDSIAEWTQLSN
jgi:FMN phosphatase YigB (HAD superfamily)